MFILPKGRENVSFVRIAPKAIELNLQTYHALPDHRLALLRVPVQLPKEIHGRVYEGVWVRGVKQGEGILHTGKGQVYEGNFEDDLYHGQGVLRGPDQEVLEGQWKRGRLNGMRYDIAPRLC